MRVVNQPFLFGWHDGALHIQAFDVLEDDPRDWKKAQAKLLNKAMAERIQKELKARKEKIDWDAVSQLSHDPRGIPVSVSGGPDQLDHIVASATIVQNKVAPGATWDGISGPAGRRGHVPGAGVRSRAVGGIRGRRRRAVRPKPGARQLSRPANYHPFAVNIALRHRRSARADADPMVLPLHDDNPTTTKPYVTVGIIIACALVYVVAAPAAARTAGGAAGGLRASA